MTKLGVQPPDEEKAVDAKDVKDPKVFTVVQPTFVPIPVQQTVESKRGPSTLCLAFRMCALIFIASLFVSGVVFSLWSREDIARALYRDRLTDRVKFSEPQFSALNSQQEQQQKKEETLQNDDGAQITIKQTDQGTQMVVQLPKVSNEEMEKQRQQFLQMAGQKSSEEGNNSSEEQQEEEEPSTEERPMHPYEMEGPSPDYYNFHHNPMAVMQWRQAQYENEMRAWRMRRLQQILMLAAMQQQREAVMRQMMWQRQQWMAQHMAAQQAMQRQAEWQEYLRRVAVFRMMQQQQAMAAEQQVEQPRPLWTLQQQEPMQWPQQQMMPHPQFYWQQPQFQQQQVQMPFVQQPVLAQPETQGPQVPQAQPLLLFQQPQPAEQARAQPQQPTEEETPVHSFIFIRRFFPISQDQEQQQAPQPEVSASVDEASQDKNVPLRPHDASAQQIVEQMKGTNNNNLPPAPIPGIHDRIFQRFQSISQQMQMHDGQPSQPPVFRSIVIDAPATQNYDQDKIYQEMQRKSMEVQKSEDAIDSVLKQEPLLGADDHDVRRGEMALADGVDTPKIRDGEVTTTTEPVMIENLHANPEENDAPTEEEKAKTSQLDPEELREAAALEASLEREAKEEQDNHEAEKAMMAVMETANQESSEEKEETPKETEEDKDSVDPDESEGPQEPATVEQQSQESQEQHDPLADFFRFFENQAVKLSSESETPERVVVDSETGAHSVEEQPPTPLTSTQMDDGEMSGEIETKIASQEADAPMPAMAA